MSMINIEMNFKLPEKQPYEGKATQKQKQKIWELGYRDQSVIDDLGKKQASALIDHITTLYKNEISKQNTRKWLIFWGMVLIAGVLIWLKIKFYP